MDVYDGLDQKKMNRAAMKLYIDGDKKPTDSVDLTEINKVWEGKDLRNKDYGEFWKGDDPMRRPSRGSQSVKRSRGGSRGSQMGDGGSTIATPDR